MSFCRGYSLYGHWLWLQKYIIKICVVHLKNKKVDVLDSKNIATHSLTRFYIKIDFVKKWLKRGYKKRLPKTIKNAISSVFFAILLNNWDFILTFACVTR